MGPRSWIVALVVLLPGVAAAGQVSVRFEQGYVTVTATNAPLRDVLAEWARQGHTQFVNAEKIPGGLVTIELVHVPEKQALEVLLRPASGYLAAPRATLAGGPSAYDRVVVMPTSTAPPPGPMPAAARAPVRPPVFPQPAQPPVAIDDEGQPPNFNPGIPPTGLPDGPDEDLPTAQVPPFGRPADQDVVQQPQAGTDPNALPTGPVPYTPGPTPLLPGALTEPLPGQIPVPPVQKQPQ